MNLMLLIISMASLISLIFLFLEIFIFTDFKSNVDDFSYTSKNTQDFSYKETVTTTLESYIPERKKFYRSPKGSYGQR